MTKEQIWHLQRWRQPELPSSHGIFCKVTLPLHCREGDSTSPLFESMTTSTSRKWCYITSKPCYRGNLTWALFARTHTRPELSWKRFGYLESTILAGSPDSMERPHTGTPRAPPDMCVKVLPDDSSPQASSLPSRGPKHYRAITSQPHHALPEFLTHGIHEQSKIAVGLSHYLLGSWVRGSNQNRWIAKWIEGWTERQMCDQANRVKY